MTVLSLKEVKKLYYGEKISVVKVAEKLQKHPKSVFSFMERNNLKRRTAAETNRIRYEREPLSFKIKKNLSKPEEKLRIAAIMLYWTEGAKPNIEKRKWTVDLVNSDPRMIKLFLKFLRTTCAVDETRLRVFLYCYANQNIKSLKRYWQNVTNIPLDQFTKPYVRTDFLPEKIGKMPHGLIHIRYNDKKLLIQIFDWIEEYLEENNIICD